jgi:mannitol/fructose-specific phosphotransferase system IIA component (Ntr-type)
MKADTKWEAIEELVAVMRASGEVPEAALDLALDAVLARERQISTGMEHGIAIPHGAIEGIDRIYGALGTSPRGIPFDSIDGEPARIVIALLIPAREFQVHLTALAGIARLFNRESLRRAIVSSEDPSDAHGALVREEELEDGF